MALLIMRREEGREVQIYRTSCGMLQNAEGISITCFPEATDWGSFNSGFLIRYKIHEPSFFVLLKFKSESHCKLSY